LTSRNRPERDILHHPQVGSKSYTLYFSTIFPCFCKPVY
jgi:hypothetical protein